MNDKKCDVSKQVKPKRGVFITAGVIFSAILASACCWLPVILITLGLSAAGAASFFGALRPYFITLTVVLLGIAFYFAYRKPAEVETCCDTPEAKKRRSWTRRGLWGITVMVILFITYPYYGGKLISTGDKNLSPTTQPAAPPSGSATTQPVRKLSVIKMDIKGMTCDVCATTIEKKLNNTTGVTNASVSLKDNSATVEFDREKITPADLIKTIEVTGYRAVIKPEG